MAEAKGFMAGLIPYGTASKSLTVPN